MNLKKALSIINRQIPCGHHNIDTNLGNGTIWAKCEDCGETFQQENIEIHRKSETEFQEAFDLICKLLDEPQPKLIEGVAYEMHYLDADTVRFTRSLHY